jgi:acetolactate decarboxylase
MRIPCPVRFLGLALLAASAALPQPLDRVLFQTSTIDALLQGVYDGEMTFAELRQHGDFGIGTLNGVDGEMIAIGGRFFQIASDGKARPIADSVRTPFASVTRFRPEITLAVAEPVSFAELQRKIEAALPSPNYFYAIRVTGRFDAVKTRSVPRQHPPYIPLSEVVKVQPTFDFAGVEGTLAGFRCPELAKGINVPGYHIHFLNKEENAGGHVLAFVLRQGTVEIDIKREIRISLPATGAFGKADFVRDRSRELQRVEK